MNLEAIPVDPSLVPMMMLMLVMMMAVMEDAVPLSARSHCCSVTDVEPTAVSSDYRFYGNREIANVSVKLQVAATDRKRERRDKRMIHSDKAASHMTEFGWLFTSV